jgi:hypothetical protein
VISLNTRVWFCFWCFLLLCSSGESGHISYRTSKLTRILQSSLGGNARTAIICTVSPSLSHVEQTRNTLSFATNAKEVVNTARVNMVRLTPKHDHIWKIFSTLSSTFIVIYFSWKFVLNISIQKFDSQHSYFMDKCNTKFKF